MSKDQVLGIHTEDIRKWLDASFGYGGFRGDIIPMKDL